jgi:hypothetical protein
MKRNGSELASWLDSIPVEFASGDEQSIEIQVSVSMDARAWFTYARAARLRGLPLRKILSEVLQSEDCEYENRGYKTRTLWEQEREKAREAVIHSSTLNGHGSLNRKGTRRQNRTQAPR